MNPDCSHITTTSVPSEPDNAWVTAILADIGVKMYNAGIDVTAMHPLAKGYKESTAVECLRITQNRDTRADIECLVSVIAQQERRRTAIATIPADNASMSKVLDFGEIDPCIWILQ